MARRTQMERTSRQEAAERTRRTLIDAGLRLTEQTGLAGLSVNRLVEEAGVAKGTFFHHFGDRAGYLTALHRDFHDRLMAEILAAIDGIPPGPERLLKAAHTYLDACLRDRGVRSLLLEARAERPVAEEVQARNAAAAELCEPDFEAMGWPHPLRCGRLWVAMCAEGAIVELEAAGRERATRAALARFVASVS
jgi:TetR/AcrR family transcriptional regulator, transcriptional repressor for nem operon